VHRRAPRGAIAIEFGLVLLLLVPLVVGTVEVGRALYAYDTLVKTVRSAARHLAVGKPEESARQMEARCIVVTGSPANSGSSCTETALLTGLTTGMVTILERTTSDAVKGIATGSGVLDVVTVSVSGYPLSTLGTTIFPDLTFGAISVTVPHVFF
jgi:Flp pilus assembly protein TadG